METTSVYMVYGKDNKHLETFQYKKHAKEFIQDNSSTLHEWEQKGSHLFYGCYSILKLKVEREYDYLMPNRSRYLQLVKDSQISEIRKNALAKLTAQEIEVLGIKEN